MAGGQGRGAQVLFDGPMMASQMGRDGFDRPPMRAQGLRLLICRHPLRPVVCHLLLGWGHRNRRFRKSCTRVVILGGDLVMRHVLELVKRSGRHPKDLLEGRCQLLQEMASVGHLGGIGSPLPNA